jgi:hypothetical protein
MNTVSEAENLVKEFLPLYSLPCTLRNTILSLLRFQGPMIGFFFADAAVVHAQTNPDCQILPFRVTFSVSEGQDHMYQAGRSAMVFQEEQQLDRALLMSSTYNRGLRIHCIK